MQGKEGKEGKEGDVPPAPNALATSSEATDGAARLNSSLEIHPETKSSAPSPAKPLPPALTDTFASPRAKNPDRTASGPAQHLPRELVGSLSPQDRERGVPKTPPPSAPGGDSHLLVLGMEKLDEALQEIRPLLHLTLAGFQQVLGGQKAAG